MTDVIERQAAIDMFETFDNEWNQRVSTTWANAYAECAEMIREMPSAPERIGRIGKWILFYDENWSGGGGFRCSICGQGYSFGAYHEANEFKFCPACGARMENAV